MTIQFNKTLTYERLRKLLDYDPETGYFSWRVSKRPRGHGKGWYLIPSGRYSSSIKVNGKNIKLGAFDTKKEARAAYLAAIKKYKSALAGTRAGTINNHGYVMIQIDRVTRKAARLAWLWMTGDWPNYDVDHINRVRTDDRWCNLREATRSQTNANRSNNKIKIVPLKGVAYYEHIDRYIAHIGTNQEHIYLGCFRTPEEAHAAYAVAAKNYFGRFACTK